MTRQNVDQLDEFDAIADKFGAQLRITRLRPSGRGADVWDELHPTAAQQRQMYDWLVARGDDVLTGDSFFHLSAYGEALPGLNLCGAGRVVCLIDPVGDVYACPFAIHENFLAGNVRSPGGFEQVWRDVGAVPRAARAADGRRVPLVRALRRLPGRVHGGEVLHRAAAGRAGPGVRARVRRAGAGGAGGGRGGAALGRRPLPPPPGGADARRAAGQGVRDQPARRRWRPIDGWARPRPAPDVGRGPDRNPWRAPPALDRLTAEECRDETGRAHLARGRRRGHGARAHRIAGAARPAPAVGHRRADRGRRRPPRRRPDDAARPAAGLRRVRRARGVRGHAVDRARGAAGGARRAGPVGGGAGRRGWCSSTGTAATCPTVAEAVVQLRRRRPRRRVVRAAPCPAATRTRAAPRRRSCSRSTRRWCGWTRPRSATRPGCAS